MYSCTSRSQHRHHALMKIFDKYVGARGDGEIKKQHEATNPEARWHLSERKHSYTLSALSRLSRSLELSLRKGGCSTRTSILGEEKQPRKSNQSQIWL